MGVIQILELPDEGERFTLDGQASGYAAGVCFTAQGIKATAATQYPKCIAVETLSAEFPQQTCLGLGSGALLHFETAADMGGAAAPGTIVYMAADGTLTQTKPTTGTAGQTCWMVGVVAPLETSPTANSTRMRVKIAPIRVEA